MKFIKTNHNRSTTFGAIERKPTNSKTENNIKNK